MPKEFLTLQEASDLTGKSAQTLRRAIKGGKLRFRKKKTPQGFNYKVDKQSLLDLYKITVVESSPVTVIESEKVENKKAVESKVESEETAVAVQEEASSENNNYLEADEFRTFAKTMERLINQHTEERQQFLRLINTLQDKIFVMENQLQLLQAPKKSWYQFWK
jgi:hypothetical protein